MDTSNVNELKHHAEFYCNRLRDGIEESGGGAEDVQLTVIEAEHIIKLIEGLIAHLKD